MKEGFYKVKFNGTWMVGQYYPDPNGQKEHDTWYLCGTETMFENYEFDEIGERIEFNQEVQG